jgi:hypothetical protein
VYRHGSLLAVLIVMNLDDSRMEPYLNSWIFIIDVQNVNCFPHPEIMTRPIVLSIHHSAGSSDGGNAAPGGGARRTRKARIETL